MLSSKVTFHFIRDAFYPFMHSMIIKTMTLGLLKAFSCLRTLKYETFLFNLLLFFRPTCIIIMLMTY